MRGGWKCFFRIPHWLPSMKTTCGFADLFKKFDTRVSIFFRNDKIIEPIKQSNRYTQVVCRGLWSFPARLSLLDSDYTSLCSILQLWKLLNMSPFLFVVKATLKPSLSSPSEKALTTKCTASRAYSKHWTPFSFRSVDLSKQKKITLNRGALNCFGIMTFGYL